MQSRIFSGLFVLKIVGSSPLLGRFNEVAKVSEFKIHIELCRVTVLFLFVVICTQLNVPSNLNGEAILVSFAVKGNPTSAAASPPHRLTWQRSPCQRDRTMSSRRLLRERQACSVSRFAAARVVSRACALLALLLAALPLWHFARRDSVSTLSCNNSRA